MLSESEDGTAGSVSNNFLGPICFFFLTMNYRVLYSIVRFY